MMSLIVDLLIGSAPCIVGSVPPWLGAALIEEVLHMHSWEIFKTAYLQQENTIAVDMSNACKYTVDSASGAAEHLSIFPFGK